MAKPTLYKNLETTKYELEFDYSDYKALPMSDKSEVRRYFNWSRNAGRWISKGKNFPTSAKQIAAKFDAKDGGEEGKALKEGEQPTKRVKPLLEPSKRYDKIDFSMLNVSESDIPYQTAYDAYRMTSFSPEKRAKTVQKDWVNLVKNTFNDLSKLAKTPRQKGILMDEMADFVDGAKKKYLEWLSAKSRTYSVMITGASKFNNRRHKKANDAEQNKSDKLWSWVEWKEGKIKTKINRNKESSMVEGEEYDRLIAKLAGVLSFYDYNTKTKSFTKEVYQPASKDLIKQNFVGTVQRSFKNDNKAAVQRVLSFLKEIQENSGKQIFTYRHKIWKMYKGDLTPKKTVKGSFTKPSIPYNTKVKITAGWKKGGTGVTKTKKKNQTARGEMITVLFDGSKFRAPVEVDKLEVIGETKKTPAKPTPKPAKPTSKNPYYNNAPKAVLDIRKALKAKGLKLNVSKNKLTSGLYSIRIGTNDSKQFAQFEKVAAAMLNCKESFMSNESCSTTPNCIRRDDSGVYHYKRVINFVPRSTLNFLKCLESFEEKKTPANAIRTNPNAAELRKELTKAQLLPKEVTKAFEAAKKEGFHNHYDYKLNKFILTIHQQTSNKLVAKINLRKSFYGESNDITKGESYNQRIVVSAQRAIITPILANRLKNKNLGRYGHVSTNTPTYVVDTLKKRGLKISKSGTSRSKGGTIVFWEIKSNPIHKFMNEFVFKMLLNNTFKTKGNAPAESAITVFDEKRNYYYDAKDLDKAIDKFEEIYNRIYKKSAKPKPMPKKTTTTKQITLAQLRKKAKKIDVGNNRVIIKIGVKYIAYSDGRGHILSTKNAAQRILKPYADDLIKLYHEASNGTKSTTKAAITALQRQIDRLPKKPKANYPKTRNLNKDHKTEGKTTGEKRIIGYEKANVYKVPLKDISTNEQIFQNRNEAYSKKTFNSILGDIKKRTFIIQVLDPILLYLNEKNNQLFVLSGHSRLAAFKAAKAQGLKIKTNDFSTIPARILRSSKIPLELAVRIARTSNSLATPEDITARVQYYWQLLTRIDRKEVDAQIKKLENRNATTINAYTYLHKTGKTFRALQALENGEVASENVVKTIAYFIGRARKKWKFLTVQHENEMFDFLLNGGYGSGSGKVNTVNDFLKEVERLIIKNTHKDGKFNASKPLNFKNLVRKTNVEKEFDKQFADAIRQLNAAEKARRLKSAKVLEAQAADKKKGIKKAYNELFAQYMKLLKKQHDAVDNATRLVRNLLLQRPSVIRTAGNELTLFA